MHCQAIIALIRCPAAFQAIAEGGRIDRNASQKARLQLAQLIA